MDGQRPAGKPFDISKQEVCGGGDAGPDRAGVAGPRSRRILEAASPCRAARSVASHLVDRRSPTDGEPTEGG